MILEFGKSKLAKLKDKLAKTDYRILKQLEKIPEVAALVASEYGDELAKREVMREAIRALEEAEKNG